jgi:predicted nuclease with TOPRIM domain
MIGTPHSNTRLESRHEKYEGKIKQLEARVAELESKLKQP